LGGVHGFISAGAHSLADFSIEVATAVIKPDLAAMIDEARRVDLKGVFPGLARPLNGVERVESRVVAMGRSGQPRTFLIEFRKGLKKRKLSKG
jgi:hypothetical protein